MTASDAQLLLSRFRAFLGREGLRLTRQREAIARVFFTTDAHLTLNDLLDRAKVHEPSLGYATVYRTMKMLTDGGLAREHQFGDGHARFEAVREGEHHDHLICLDCGRIEEFECAWIERRQTELARARGFAVESHRHEVYGRCQDEACEHRP